MTDALPFIDPTAGRTRPRIALARRPVDLAGKVVGLLDNSKEQADIILDAVGTVLRERYGVAQVVARRKPYFSKPATDELINAMTEEVDVAIAALGG